MSCRRKVEDEVNHLGPIGKGIPNPVALFPEDGQASCSQNIVLKFVALKTVYVQSLKSKRFEK
jgi:hypothetical protein